MPVYEELEPAQGFQGRVPRLACRWRRCVRLATSKFSGGRGGGAFDYQRRNSVEVGGVDEELHSEAQQSPVRLRSYSL
jgi:hypothetical protein